MPAPRLRNPAGDSKGHGGGESTNQGGLEAAANDRHAGETAFDAAENREGDNRDSNGYPQSAVGVLENQVGAQWYQAADDVGHGNGKGTLPCTGRVWFFQAQFEAHHEIDPVFRTLPQGVDHGGAFIFGKAIAFENVFHFLRFDFRLGADFLFFTDSLAGVMLGVATCGQVAAQAHRNRTGGNFGKPGGDNDLRLRDGAG